MLIKNLQSSQVVAVGYLILCSVPTMTQLVIVDK